MSKKNNKIKAVGLSRQRKNQVTHTATHMTHPYVTIFLSNLTPYKYSLSPFFISSLIHFLTNFTAHSFLSLSLNQQNQFSLLFFHGFFFFFYGKCNPTTSSLLWWKMEAIKERRVYKKQIINNIIHQKHFNNTKKVCFC